MYQERRSVFETNSSSTHSICITKDTRADHSYPKKLVFRLGEFGWEHEELFTPEEKAAYLYTSILSLQTKEEAERSKNKIFAVLGEVGIDCEFEQAEYWGDGWLSNGYVDHAGDGDHYDFVNKTLNNRNRLLRYLFSEQSFVLTGNDNDDYGVGIDVDYPHEECYKGN